MLKDNKLFNQVGGWRLPTKSEANDFIEYLKNNYPKCDIGGACWTSTSYKDSDITCWVANFDLDSSFARFHGTRNSSHGYFHGCIRLVCPIEDLGAIGTDRLTETDEYWIDHQANLVWNKMLISDSGMPTSEAHNIWVGSLLETVKIIALANVNITEE
jgi:hypothetical protein